MLDERTPNERNSALLVFDAYPLIALLLGERAAVEVTALLADSIDDRFVTTLNAAEVVDTVGRRPGVDSGALLDTVDAWLVSGLQTVDVTWSLARRAATVRTRYYGRATPVSLADCTAIALAEDLGATLVTSDKPMLRVARELAVDVHQLPDSRGN